MESDTPRTDANVINVDYETREPDGEPSQVIEEVVLVDFARQLERELAAAIQQRDGYIDGNRQTLRALAEANEIAARYKRERDEARRDAERYRWLKSDGCYWVHIRSRPHGDLVFQGRYGRAFYHHQGTAEMDDVIDSCIAAQRKGMA